MQYKIYTTCENDRWDNISNKFYGSPFEYARLFEANPDIQKSEILPAGIQIKIPYFKLIEAIQTVPWK